MLNVTHRKFDKSSIENWGQDVYGSASSRVNFFVFTDACKSTANGPVSEFLGMKKRESERMDVAQLFPL